VKTKIGDVVEVDGKTRIVTGFLKNKNDDTIVIWAQKRDVGGCMPSIWEEWVNGFDSRRRRGLKSRFNYKF